MNKCIFIGRITKDIDLQFTQKENAYLMNSVAVQRNYKNQNGEYEADFIDFIAYGQKAELISNYFKKGDRIGLVGRLETRTYQNQLGTTIYVKELKVDEIEFLQEKKDDSQPTPRQTAQPEAPKQFEVEDDDLPF